MSGYGPYSAEQIAAMVKQSTLSEMVELKAQHEAEWKAGTNQNARTITLIELHLVQHLLGEHERAGQASPIDQTTVATVDQNANATAHGNDVMECGPHG